MLDTISPEVGGDAQMADLHDTREIGDFPDPVVRWTEDFDIGEESTVSRRLDSVKHQEEVRVL
ncbi:MAG TPA: hypothetical protein VEG66_01610 [Thermoplasmata archaeon]|nr:hypothetical protein [Thermoplasmata archaeon]